MVNKITYAFYFNTFNNGCKGALSKENLPFYAVKAWRELKSLLSAEPDEENSDAVLHTVCEIAEELFKAESRRGIKSENTDGYSVTYADEVPLKKKIIEIAVKRLHATGLLYMGVERC